MARPIKIGLKYFSFDVDFFSDEKIGAISGEFGIKGEITAVKLLCAIYRNGYFILWDEALKMNLLKNLPGISLELLEKIVNRLVKWGFFEQDLFSTARVLSSKGIQKRYFDAIKRRKELSEYPYLLITVDINDQNVGNNRFNVDNNKSEENVNKCIDVCNNGINVDNNSINAYISTQRKEKKSKENIIIPPTPPKGVENLKEVISEKDRALDEALAKIKDLEETIAQSKPAKPKRPNGLNSNARKAFEEHFRNTFGEEYYWTAKDAGNMLQLLRKLTFSREQKQMPVDDASVLYALQVFLQSIKDGWLLENFSVANLNSKYNEIISNVRKEYAPRTGYTNIYEQKRIDSERRKSQLMAEFAEADAKFLAEQEAKRKAVGDTGEISDTFTNGG